MKVFVSSLITGMEVEREAARRAICALGHEPIMAETFGAKTSSPQVACLQGLRQSDLVVLILGERYGAKQKSGLSATHEEVRDAQNRKPVLVFVADGAAEPEQAALMKEVGGWEAGLHRAPFRTADELGGKVTKAIHDFELAHAVAPLDPEALRTRSLSLMPDARREDTPTLALAIATGPAQAVLRPAEIENAALAKAMKQEAMFGDLSVFDPALGAQSRPVLSDGLVIFQQSRYGRETLVSLRESGDIYMQVPAENPDHQSGFSAIIEEDITAKLLACVSYAAWLLGRIDPTEKVTHVALAARLSGGSFYGWHTRSEQAASPSSGTMSMFGNEPERIAPVMLTPAHQVRQALTMNAPRLVEDLVALLRRQRKDS